MLPVEHIFADLHHQLTTGDAIVVAPPGAGKSTCLPLSLLKLSLFSKTKIILLQPRRIAVRNIAQYLAHQLGEPVGQTVGYRIRGENKVSANTRLEIVTEGILTRMLQSQPELPDVGLVIFDEFHERSLHADFSLALCLEVQQALREDLRLLVMSATLETEPLQTLLPRAKVLVSEGKSYPVEINYRPDNSRLPLAEKVSRLIIDVWPQHQRDCLVFLPGAFDINKVSERLSQYFSDDVKICRLFADLSKSEQKSALLPDPQGKRKIVLATNIAETSLTIEGIEVVVDSGIEKQAVFQLNRGVTHLQNQKISQASATQRTGRAGRLGPGTCYRLWGAEQHTRLAKQSTPEILLSDMSSFILESTVWGAKIQELALLDYPADAQLNQGFESLQQLDVLDTERRLTSLGKQAYSLGTQINIALMLVKSATLSEQHVSLACTLAALFENKDPLTVGNARLNDIGVCVSTRVQYLDNHKNHVLWQRIKQWHKKMKCPLTTWPIEDIAVLIGFSYPFWLAKKRQGVCYQLVNGCGGILFEEDSLVSQQWIAIANMQTSDKQQDNAQIRYAESISMSQIEAHFSHMIKQHKRFEWDEKSQKIMCSEQTKLGKILIQTQPVKVVNEDKISAIWQQIINKKGINVLPFNGSCLQLIHRVRLAASLFPEKNWPDFTNEGLLNSIDNWLIPYITDKLSWQQLTQCDFTQQLKNELNYDKLQQLELLLPQQISLPSGRNGKVNYTEQKSACLSVRMQELYGLQQHPSVADGRLPITVELLSPAHRPIQTTQDLPGFWLGTYKDVQKEMKGRYPRHFWPDAPHTAQATTTTKKKMKVNS